MEFELVIPVFEWLTEFWALHRKATLIQNSNVKIVSCGTIFHLLSVHIKIPFCQTI
jgi:hypothetical protein